MELSACGLAVLEAIVRAPLAWSRWAVLEAAGHTAETLVELYALGLLEPWDLPGREVAWTLSPHGAEFMAVELAERPAPLRVPRGVDVEWLDELPHDRPYWVAATPRGVRLPRRGVRVRREPHTTRLPFDGVNLVDPAPGPPEVVMDEWSGKPLLLFAGEDGRGGFPVRVVRKRGRKPGTQARPKGRKAKAAS
jgi:hypothetical protein